MPPRTRRKPATQPDTDPATPAVEAVSAIADTPAVEDPAPETDQATAEDAAPAAQPDAEPQADPAPEPDAQGEQGPEQADAAPQPEPEPAYHWETVATRTPADPCRVCVPGGPPAGVGVFGCVHGQWVRVLDTTD